MAALSYGVVVRWPPAVAHGGTGLSRPLSLYIAEPRAEHHPRSAPVERTGHVELRGCWSMAGGCCAQRYWQKQVIPQNRQRKWCVALTNALSNLRAREQRAVVPADRGAPAAPAAAFLFVEFFLLISFCDYGWGDAGPREGWSSERLARTLLRSAPAERTGRAELRGRCSLAAGCCAQRYWGHLTSLAQRARRR